MSTYHTVTGEQPARVPGTEDEALGPAQREVPWRGGTCRPESPDQEAVVSFMSSQDCRGKAAFLNVTVHHLESNMATQSQVQMC